MITLKYQDSLERRLGETLEKEKRNQSIISQLRQRIRELEKIKLELCDELVKKVDALSRFHKKNFD